jgi:hypothetical protein
MRHDRFQRLHALSPIPDVQCTIVRRGNYILVYAVPFYLQGARVPVDKRHDGVLRGSHVPAVDVSVEGAGRECFGRVGAPIDVCDGAGVAV